MQEVASNGSATGEPQPAPSGPEDDVRAAVIRSRELLEAGEYREFLEAYLPADELQQFRESDDPDAMAEQFGSFPLMPALIAFLRVLETQTPEFESDGAIAVYSIVEPQETPALDGAPITSDMPAHLTRAPADQAPGYGDDLSAALTQAADALESGAVADFVERMFPLSEIGGDVAPIEQRLAANPAMAEAMVADLRAAAAADPQIDGSIAEFTFAGAGPYRPDRVIRFQLVGDNWRLFNAAQPIRDVLVAQFESDPFTPPTKAAEGNIFRMELVGDAWRFHDLSVLDELMSQPPVDGSPVPSTTIEEVP